MSAAQAVRFETASFGRGSDFALAAPGCSQCFGRGRVEIRSGKKTRRCDCVWRAICRDCLERFMVSREAWTWRDYRADFLLIARRNLPAAEWELFRLHFLLGVGWRECCPILKLDRGEFYHAVYRIEKRLGRAFSRTRPYALYPVERYFH